ncbi:MAG: DUF6663 family protein [Halobacteriaceae archaeon]
MSEDTGSAAPDGATTTERLRVLGTPRDGSEWLLVDVDGDHDPRFLPRAALPEQVRAGNVVEVSLSWTVGAGAGAEPSVRDVAVVEETLLAFVDGATNLFEAALDTWAEARREDLAVNARVTYDASREPVGALYTFAEQSGARDVFEELRTGTLPLEPILERAAASAPPPHEVFVLRPVAHEFVLVYVVLERGSTLADTVRDTYNCPQ